MIISHVVITLTSSNPFLNFQEYVVDVSKATTDITKIILLIFRHFGLWGNSLFFICSAWFLLKKSEYKKKKCFLMLTEIWSVSILILVVSYILLHGNISAGIILQSIFPTLFGTNWYMTCYLLFYALHPILNGIIERMNQQQLFRNAGILVILYIFLGFIDNNVFFPSRLILWVTLYFAIAYMQRYLIHYADNIKLNIILVILNAFGFVGIIFLTEFAGLHISAFEDKMLYWATNCNPFLIFMSLSMFNLARTIHFKSKFVNWISSFSLLIYIIHENLILRTYFRPVIWNYVYRTYGYTHVISWVFILTIIVFLFGLFCSVVYSSILKGKINQLSEKVYSYVKKIYLKTERKLLDL